MIKTVQQKYAVLDNAQLQGLLATPPALLTAIQFKSALASHDSTIDPAVVSQVIAKATPAIQAQFKAWLEIAVKETAGGRAATESALLYVQPWGKEAMGLVDNMKLKTSPAAAEPPAADATIEPAGKPIAPAGVPEVVKIGNQEIKPTDPLYDKIMAAVNGT
jgi:hypothetical protein